MLLEDPEATTVDDELEIDALDRLVEETLADEVETLLEVLDDDPDISTVEVDDEELAEDVVDDDVLAEDVVELLPVLWLDQDCVLALVVDVLLDDIPTIVLDVDDVDDVDSLDGDDEDVEEVLSEENDLVDELDEEEWETSTEELLDVLLLDSSSSTI